VINLLDVLRDACAGPPPEVVAPLVAHFRAAFGEGLQAVVFYGSRLDAPQADPTTLFDFFLVVDDYGVLPRRRDRWLARFLPPNIYFLELPHGETTLRAKYCVITADDLREQVGAGAQDFYHVGRFSKRVALVWWRDTYERDEVLGCCVQAMQSVTEHAINKVGNEFTLDEFVRAALRLSYDGEVRLEKTEEKVAALFAAAAPFYRQVFGALLAEYRAARADVFHDAQPNDPPGVFYMRRSVSVRAAMYEDTRQLIDRSRRRAKARWPKGIILVDNWLDYLLAKVERTYGTKIELTPLERRFALILGWKYFFRLKREGKIR
jgi:Phosphatidate cytidylyltransferase, mitochondrial